MLRKSRRPQGPPADAGGAHRALAMVLLDAPRPLTPDTLTAAWRATWPQHRGPIDIQAGAGDDGLGTMAMTLDGLFAGLGVMPVTIPGGELDGPAMTSWLWPNATEDIARGNAHVIAWASGGAHALEPHLALTRLVAAVIRATSALGVYWGGQVIRGDVFDELAHDSGRGLPVMLWIDFRGYLTGSSAGLFTVGLGEFGLMEIEVARSSLPLGDLREMVMGLSTYLIQQGPVIGDGDTVGGSEAQRILVRHRPSAVGRPGTVYSLEGL